MKTVVQDGQRFESIETAVRRLVRETDTVQVDNRYLPQLLEMAARHEITIVGDSTTKGYTTVSAFPETTHETPSEFTTWGQGNGNQNGLKPNSRESYQDFHNTLSSLGYTAKERQ